MICKCATNVIKGDFISITHVGGTNIYEVTNVSLRTKEAGTFIPSTSYDSGLRVVIATGTIEWEMKPTDQVLVLEESDVQQYKKTVWAANEVWEKYYNGIK